MNRHLLTSEEELTIDQSSDNNQSSTRGISGFIGVTYKSLDEGLLTEAEIPQSPASPKLTLAWMKAHKNEKFGTHCTVYGQLNKLESFLSGANSVGVSLFQAAQVF